MTEAGEKQLAIRRAQVQAAVKRWRVKHKDQYNAYTREYLKISQRALGNKARVFGINLRILGSSPRV